MSYKVHILSDGTGHTAERLLNSALVQFYTVHPEIIIHPNVRTVEQLSEIFIHIQSTRSFVIHTIVSFELRNKLLDFARHFNVFTIDLMGPTLSQLSSLFSLNPAEKPGMFHELNKAYFERIDAIEFALKHDDGLRQHDLSGADIILLGVSRTFKTPLCVYLANLGWKAANIPIIPDFTLPESLSLIDPNKIFCLTTVPSRLSELRQVRADILRNQVGTYADFYSVEKELDYATKIFRKHPQWKVVEVTNKPIEEIATTIISYLKGRFITDLNK